MELLDWIKMLLPDCTKSWTVLLADVVVVAVVVVVVVGYVTLQLNF